MTLAYEEFVAEKVNFDRHFGFDVTPADVHPLLKPHQADLVRWAVKGGRRAIFAAFGLGKSLIQLETLRLVIEREGGAGLIIAPLGVRGEFIRDARKVGQDVRFIRRTDQLDGPGLYVTNYESVRDGKLDVAAFTAVSLDEASVLRSYGSKTYQSFLAMFDQVPFRFVATATPSPNRFKELIHYAGFLGVMDTGQALTRFFQRDSTKANNLTLYPHKETEFWLWLASWAVFLQSPADLGHDATGYDLPKLEVHWEQVTTALASDQIDRDGQHVMFRDAALSLQASAREKRDTLPARIERMLAVLDSYDGGLDQVVIWCDLNAEQDAIEAALTAAGISFSSVHGSLDDDEVERRLDEWRDRRTTALIGKPVMLGQGLNLQQCNKAVFVGITYKFNDTIQAVHRIQRFGQTRTCDVRLIYAETEAEVKAALQRKWAQHEELTQQMTQIIREHGLDKSDIAAVLSRAMGVDRVDASGEGWLVANNDCVAETRGMEEGSVDLIVTSIPFSNHYEYTPNYNDFGHTDDNAHFWAQMDYLTPELLRVLAPGRIYACHVKDRILFGNVTGAGVPTVSPFHAEAITHGIRHGFDYMGMITVVTDVVRENNQTYRLGWSEMAKDGTKMGAGSPEYILLFHKPQTDRTKGYADVPVTKDKAQYSRARWQVDAHAFWRSSGDRHLTLDELTALPVEDRSRLFTEQTLREVYDYESHVRIGEILDGRGALPATFMSLAPGSWHPEVWHDVNRMLTLNGEQKQRNLAMHVCLARDSRVLTRERGYVPIQEVRVGEHTLTHKGNWKPVLAVQNTGVRPVVTVRAQGVPGLTLTPDHKLWARDSRNYARQADYVAWVEPDWLPAEDAMGAYVNLKLPAASARDADPALWWMVGRWLADGHRGTHGEAIVSIGSVKWAEFEEHARPWLGNQVRELNALQIALRDPDHQLRDILDRCGSGAGGKHLPPEAFTLPQPLAAALLDGYMSGDGHLTPGRRTMQATSVSRDLVLGLAMLAQRVHDVTASVFAGRPPGQTTIDGREVTTRQEWVLTYALPGDRRKKSLVLDDGAWKRVRSVEPAGDVETWNLRVADDESYTAEGCIVKNCPLQFDIVDRLIERYSNPGDVVFDPFGGLMTVPVRALRAGRRGRGVELNSGYFLDGVKYCQAEERRRDMPTLFDLEQVVS